VLTDTVAPLRLLRDPESEFKRSEARPLSGADYRSLSFWHDTLPAAIEARAALEGEVEADVAIVGAGYTGLWTAYYLSLLEPSIRIAIVEAETAGFGASGRNGGWVLGMLAGMDSRFADPAQREGAVALQRALFDSVDEVGRVSEKESIDCHFTKGGNITVATEEAHRESLLEDADAWRKLGFGEEDIHWLEPDDCAKRIAPARNFGGLYFSHCASIHPARLVRGLAEVVERRGVQIYERSPVTAIETGGVATAAGRVRAKTVVRATEGYTKTLPGHRLRLMPLHSMMIATEPLPESTWKEIGLGARETFADPRRTVIYGQRTADDRIAFGARGKYYFGSGVRDRFAQDDAMFTEIQAILESLFPILKQHRITHRWGGALGVPRDWRPSVGIDRGRGLAWAGGFVGEGVAASNLAGRTLAELILERETVRTALPLVGRQWRRWEPEPLRWLAVSTVLRTGASLDAAEGRGRKAPPLRNALFSALVKK
jgi:glycine/D-amino acid oxidase-like deaminating enzyme